MKRPIPHSAGNLPALGLGFAMLFVVVITTLRSHPYFGNMDDGLLLELASAKDPVQFAHDYGWRPSAGFLNDFSMILVWPSYWIGAVVGPTCFYLANSVTVFACILAFGLAAGRIAGWRGPWPILAFLAGALLWPYTAELFFFPSLQEKGIILGAALMFWWVSYTPRFKSATGFWASLVLACLAAFNTKTHFLVFVPAILLALWTRPEPRTKQFRRGATGATVLIVGLSTLLVLLAVTGTYSQSTRGAVGMSFLGDRRFLLLGALTGAYVIALLVRAFLHKGTSLDWVPAMMLLSMCGVFAVWEIRNYFLAIAGVMVGSALATALNWINPSWRQTTVAISLSVAACGWLLFRLPSVYASQSSIGDFLGSSVAAELAAGNATVYVSCMEAPVHYNRYAVRTGLEGLTFAYLQDAGSDLTDPPPNTHAYIIGDTRLCPWSPPSPEWTVAWTTGDAAAFQLYERSP
jgi:hypothetical protein